MTSISEVFLEEINNLKNAMVCYIGLFHAGNIKMRYFYKVAMFPLNSIFFQTKLLVS